MNDLKTMTSKFAKFALVLVFVLGSTGMAAPSQVLGTPLSVSVEAKHVRTELYFGLIRKGGPEITEEEFQRFVDEFVTPRFASGFTVIEARGQWKEDDNTITKERSKILIVIYERKERKEAGRKIEEIRAEYKRRFAQQAVLRVDQSKGVKAFFE